MEQKAKVVMLSGQSKELALTSLQEAVIDSLIRNDCWPQDKLLPKEIIEHIKKKLLNRFLVEYLDLFKTFSWVTAINARSTRDFETTYTAWSPNGRYLATSYTSAAFITLWEKDPKPVWLKGHTNAINCLCWSPDGNYLATGCNDNTTRLYSPNGTYCRKLKGTNAVTCLSWSPDNKNIAIGSEGGTVRIWDLTAKSYITYTGSTPKPLLSWSPTGGYLATTLPGNVLSIWNTPTNSTTLLRGHTCDISCHAWSPDGNYLATGSLDHSIRIWDVNLGSHVILNGHNDGIMYLSWHPSGKYLVSRGIDRAALIWDVHTGSSMRITQPVEHILWSPDGNYLAIACSGRLSIWNFQSKACANVEINLWDYITCLSWNPDGNYLTAGLEKGVIKTWGITSFADQLTWQELLAVAKTELNPDLNQWRQLRHNAYSKAGRDCTLI